MAKATTEKSERNFGSKPYVKHEYGKKTQRKHTPADFDPRPPAKRGSATIQEAKNAFCKSIEGSGVCAELLLDIS